MDNIINQIMSIVIPSLITAIGILLTWGLNELRRFVKNRTDSDQVDVAFKQFNKIATGAVIRAEQALKQYGADGKITKDEAKKVKELVVSDIKSQLPSTTESLLKKVINDIDALIDTKIEGEVYQLKQNKLVLDCK